MKYKITALLFTLLMTATSVAQAKRVIICTAYSVGINAKMDCSGFKTKETFTSLYRRGWSFAGDISGVSYKFVLVFEK